MPGRTFLHLNEKVNPMSLVNFFKTESKCVFVVAVIIDGVTDADDVTGAEAQSRLLQLVDRAVMRVRWRRLLLLWSGTGDRIEELRFEPSIVLACTALTTVASGPCTRYTDFIQLRSGRGCIVRDF